MLEFVCPKCREKVTRTGAEYRCGSCDGSYPVIAGIPDFRVFPDPWIGLEDDRAKALRLERETEGCDFEETVRAYWRMTPDTPRHLAEHFIDHVTAATRRSTEWLSVIAPGGGEGEQWLDEGCGTGDLIVAADGVRIIGVDIALRWLVAAKKRIAWESADPNLVCCCAEALPFSKATFERVLSLGLLEHCEAPGPVMSETHRVLKKGGSVDFRTVNRYSLLPEPHVGVWGVGYLPRAWADRYVRWRSGQRYIHHRPNSARELRRALYASAFSDVSVGAARLLQSEVGRLGPLGRSASFPYRMLLKVPGATNLLTGVAPTLEGHALR